MIENGTPPLEAAREAVRKQRGYIAKNPFAAINLGLSGLTETNNTPTVPEKIQKELATATFLTDPETGQKFGAIEANMDKLDPEAPLEDQTAVNIVLNLYGNSISDKNTRIPNENEEVNNGRKARNEMKYRIEQISRLGNPTISIDPPSVGKSDWIRWNQLSKNPKDSYFAIADAQLRAVRARGVKRINLMGQSFGAFQAAALAVRAAEFGIKVDNVLLYEPTGVVGMSAFELGRLNKEEYKLLDFHSSTPYDTEMVTAAGVGTIKQKNAADIIKLGAKFLLSDPLFLYASFMAPATLQDRIGQIFQNQKEHFPDMKQTRIRILSGELSTICPWKQAKEIVDSYPDQKANQQLKYEFYPGEGHLAFINAKRWLGDVRLRLYPEKSFAEATGSSG